jgi:hypothetical protein
MRPVEVSGFNPVKAIFRSQIKKAKAEGFDYWANWLEARWQGKALDLEHLKQSVVLDESVTAMVPAAFNAYANVVCMYWYYNPAHN